ncbi:hypothetical protein [uncultured Kocuria sp.]|uniref:hypothetical protein n=1 Tax=uncultured Kocuria sp. TaxID=259305 RepID=UPI002604DD7A|nr:hypothetical protein [uncultured Kocuria sp.]
MHSMHPMSKAMKAALNGAVCGAAAAVLLGLVLVLVSLVTGATLDVPGLVSAVGVTTNGASSVDFTLGWTVLVAAAVLGGLVNHKIIRKSRDAAVRELPRS